MGKVSSFNFIKEIKHNNILLCFIVLLYSKINAITFYINDNSTNEDTYIIAIGNDFNNIM